MMAKCSQCTDEAVTNIEHDGQEYDFCYECIEWGFAAWCEKCGKLCQSVRLGEVQCDCDTSK
jgi:hypothetical protein